MNTITFDNQVDQLDPKNDFLEPIIDFLPVIQQEMLKLTRNFIGLCQIMASAKPVKGDTDKEYAKLWKEGIENLGLLSSTVTPYAKIGTYLAGVDEYNLELLDVNTIKAICCDKFKPIIDRLQTERLTVVDVREEMAIINKNIRAKRQETPQSVLKWEKNKFGQRRLVIFLEDADAGDELERLWKESENPLPLFFREMMRRPKAKELIVAVELPEIITYRVRQIGLEDYIWVEDCTLIKTANPPESLWYIFKSPDEQIIKVVGEEEFEIMPVTASG